VSSFDATLMPSQYRGYACLQDMLQFLPFVLNSAAESACKHARGDVQHHACSP